MSPAQSVILLGTVVVLAALFGLGRREDRAAVLVLAAVVLLEPLVQPVQVGTWRAGLFVLNLLGLAALWTLSERSDRWWIFLAGALQSTIVWTHLLPLVSPDQFNWTLATVRLGLWCLMLALMGGRVAALVRADREAQPIEAAGSDRRPAASTRRS
ncbi:hypothetical protein [Brevundimonas sp.]|uniref:hypothetical protein n=1 Tax=Brevundimonas sp. TaxID=1871086 RepID=UPI0035B2DD40